MTAQLLNPRTLALRTAILCVAVMALAAGPRPASAAALFSSSVPVPLPVETPVFNPRHVVAGDLNGDGRTDLCVTSSSSAIALLQQCDGSFLPGSSQLANFAFVVSGLSRSVLDVTGDGRLDVVGHFQNSGFLYVLAGNGDGTFRTVPPVLGIAGSSFNSVVGSVVADFNNDGKPDMALAVDADQTGRGELAVLLSNGDGTFRPPVTSSWPAAPSAYGAIVAGDFNGDGKQDVVLAPGPTAALLLGNGDGTFQPAIGIPGTSNLPTLAAADFNGDGRSDLVATAFWSSMAVYIGNADGTLSQKPSLSVTATADEILTGDFNGDGKIDILTSGRNGMRLLLGNGDGTFQPEQALGPAGGVEEACVGDFNSDGKPDIAYVDDTGVFILYNQIGAINSIPHACPANHTVLGDIPQPLTLQGNDPHGLPLTYAVSQVPRHGTAAVSGSQVIYTSVAGYSGPDSFAFTAGDGSQTSPPATVALTVLTPLLTVSQVTASQGAETSLSVATTQHVANTAGLDLTLQVSAPAGAPSLTPTWSLGAQARGWQLQVDPFNPWHVSVVNAAGVTGPAELLKLSLPALLSAPTGTVYNLAATKAVLFTEQGQQTDATQQTEAGSLTIQCSGVKGDLNGDGQVGLGDVILLLQLVTSGKQPADACYRKVVDVNCDGQVTLADVILLLRNFVLGQPFPCH